MQSWCSRLRWLSPAARQALRLRLRPTGNPRSAPPGSVPGSGVSDGGVSVPDVRGPSRESLW
ncbi:hypothetical protein DFS55_15820 [Mycobacterium avium subsp. hominissuis]|uniref:Uncharacterized protein n=1 Tax=Mycobacterium avium subsp. hominissuis TaxID=439334 RepID=A0A3B6XB30_MYCAV|nr:hypothetical protein DFS55_15820 [Mycobacterium avium subsp. hominissuis]